MLGEKELDEILYTAKVLTVARTIGNLDENKIRNIVNSNGIIQSAMLFGGQQEVSEGMLNTLKMMTFVIPEVRKLLPTTGAVMKASNEAIQLLPPHLRGEVDRITTELAGDIADQVQRDT